jgi:hypothetical protein
MRDPLFCCHVTTLEEKKLIKRVKYKLIYIVIFTNRNFTKLCKVQVLLNISRFDLTNATNDL